MELANEKFFLVSNEKSYSYKVNIDKGVKILTRVIGNGSR